MTTSPIASELPACDLVMKGGITSGVVYPRLISRLARDYRFKCVGGTSAGAIAAAACVAAEHGRQRGLRPQAFERLAELPKTLQETVGTGAAAGSRLFHFFHPADSLSGHFLVLVGALNQPDKAALVWGAARALLSKFWPVTLIALLVALVVAWALVRGASAGAVSWWHASLALVLWLPLVAALAVALAAWRFAVTLLRGLHGNFWGLCSGHSEKPGLPSPALTDWLTSYFNDLAGLDSQGRPLVFGDLWGMPPESINTLDSAAPEPAPSQRMVDLRVMTTAVSQRLCYALPLREAAANNFYYDPDEWARLFPAAVMQWFDRVSAVEDAGKAAVTSPAGRPLRRFPPARWLPVVVAVRMSLSFPVLLSAVPMYAIDRSLAKIRKPNEATRVWFSDGGIASNMPLHFFDAPLPGRPTFAINLKGEHPQYPIERDKKAGDQKGRVYLATKLTMGFNQHWKTPVDDKPAGLFDFLTGIVETMQSWRDEIQFPYPGYRDRIVQISQLADEGGLNLNMPARHIDALSDAGECAAERLLDRYHPASAAAQRGGWAEHEETRLRTFLAQAELLLRNPVTQSTHWDQVVDRAVAAGHYNGEQRARALHMLATLRGLGQALDQDAGPALTTPPAVPLPMAEMRITPRI